MTIRVVFWSRTISLKQMDMKKILRRIQSCASTSARSSRRGMRGCFEIGGMESSFVRYSIICAMSTKGTRKFGWRSMRRVSGRKNGEVFRLMLNVGSRRDWVSSETGYCMYDSRLFYIVRDTIHLKIRLHTGRGLVPEAAIFLGMASYLDPSPTSHHIGLWSFSTSLATVRRAGVHDWPADPDSFC